MPVCADSGEIALGGACVDSGSNSVPILINISFDEDPASKQYADSTETDYILLSGLGTLATEVLANAVIDSNTQPSYVPKDTDTDPLSSNDGIWFPEDVEQEYVLNLPGTSSL